MKDFEEKEKETSESEYLSTKDNSDQEDAATPASSKKEPSKPITKDMYEDYIFHSPETAEDTLKENEAPEKSPPKTITRDMYEDYVFHAPETPEDSANKDDQVPEKSAPKAITRDMYEDYVFHSPEAEDGSLKEKNKAKVSK